MSRRQLLAALAACGLGGAALDYLAAYSAPSAEAASPAAVDAAPAGYLCLLVLDGFRPEYFGLAAMPAVSALAGTGVFYERAWVGQLESETPVGHATITSGSLPKTHGIIGFEWRDADTRRKVLDAWEPPDEIGQIGRDMQRVRVRSIPEAIKQSAPSATVVCISSEKIFAVDAMAAGAADHALYYHQVGNRLVLAGVPGALPPASLSARSGLSFQLPLKHLTDWDMLSGRLALAALQELRPKVLMVNLPGSDLYGHKFGGLDSPHVMSQVVAGQDQQIGRIVQAYRDAGIFEQTLFLVTADHGMVPNHHEFDPAVITAIGRETGAQYLFNTGGTGKYIYLTDGSQDRAAAVAAALARQPEVVAGYYRTGSGQYELASPKLDSALDGAYRYLMSTFSGLSAPDVVAPLRENTIGAMFAPLYGNHGGLSWGVQAVPLVMSGPGVRRGVRSKAPARLVDVAPTVLRLLGANLHQQDGIVLADALQSPTDAEVAAQVGLQATLSTYQDALRERSAEDVRQDSKAGVKRRRRVPVTP